eukprot:TRINITY_DN13006_c0_g1_i1.p1 TRINITY_DN13006_c0_g1~~TRINITY_DN13006_c0_g1_i1.p1  ORF type:complete len:389 (-),score=56.82 TRINITY_DN13006_c0_g1_i1:93-1259(-)
MRRVSVGLWRASGRLHLHCTATLSDLYRTLGVARSATPEEIKKAYLAKAKHLHPDVNKDPVAHKQFREVGEAYDVLKDPTRRTLYDEYGISDAQQAEAFTKEQQYNRSRPHPGNFRARARKPAPLARQPERGTDVKATLAVELEDLARTSKIKQLHFEANTSCNSCSGTGAKDNEPQVDCSDCGGGGFMEVPDLFNMAVSFVPCNGCGGTGKRIRVFCLVCKGKGVTRQQRTMDITLPPGAHDGDIIKIPSKGNCGRHGGPAGDLQVQLQLKPHDWFIAKNRDVHLSYPIPLQLALKGGPLKVLTLYGTETIEVPRGAQVGDAVRIPKCGLPDRKGGRGDMYVHLSVIIPHLGHSELDRVAPLLDALPAVHATPDLLRALKQKLHMHT